MHRRDLEKRCGAQLAQQKLKRRNYKRDLELVERSSTSSNDSYCSMTPEVTQGPYHVLGELVRQNITEGQAGVPLEVRINIIDIASCSPVQMWVDAWHANATGFYSGYIAETGSALSGGTSSGNDTMGGGMDSNSTMSGMGGGSNSTSFGGDNSTMSSGGGMGGSSSSSTNTSDYTVTSGADSESAASQLNTAVDDNETFLRGVWQSDADGLAIMYSVVPGWYSGRAQHFHVKLYTEGGIAENGTFVAGGDAHHTGQFFFDNTTLEAVAATSTYSANSIAWGDHVTNEADQWYPYQEATGYNADMDITWVGSSIEDGLIGEITIGVNLSYFSPELSTQYAAFDVEAYVSEGLDTLVTSSASATSTSSSALSSSATVTTSLVSSTSTKPSSMTKKPSITKSSIKKSAEAVKKSRAAAAAAAKKSKQAQAEKKKQAEKKHQ
ncbi:hypothetical protein BCR35DRAFT_290079 [Leucosporidium creatinivorum]|uniref:Intradiol ring-cleavage dioxygenase n=1 Tax=Leucosporidium creatinivorum TaxID=106004 RepID=A0A1Y2FMZ8_9BASI|nr:hypothetical protein BCR35DRAFT_290079 [Leucosporidium creatinivorum]